MFHLFIIVFSIFMLFILAMAIGVVFGRKPIKGSCGGLGKVMGEKCDFCNSDGKCKKKDLKAS